jgi:23S rRNA (guanosine2251-2'-O)-methyltransferase
MSETRILFGFHAVLSRMRQHATSIEEILIDRDRIDARMKDLLNLAEAANIRTMQVDRARLDGLAGMNGRHQGVLARVIDTPIPYKDIHDILESDLKEPPFFLILDGVEDPHNLGACLRVADAMGVHAVIAPKDRAVGLNATVRKVACGAAETVPFIAVTNLARTIRELKEAGVFVVGTTLDAPDGKVAPTNLLNTKLDGPIAIVLGAEGDGIRRLTAETCDALVTIPMFGSVESLNVSVASGICLYEVRRQRSLKAS